jgi:hypothetical protein
LPDDHSGAFALARKARCNIDCHSVQRSECRAPSSNSSDTMAKRIALAILAIAVLLSFVAGSWTLTYPDAADPKNMKYVLWKHGLYHLDKSAILFPLTSDSARNGVIGGRTKDQIRDMLGPLVLPADASPYLAGCIANSNLNREDILFVGNSPVAIQFENGRAEEMWVVKGC